MGFLAAQHSLDHIARHAGEAQKVFHPHAGQRANNVMHIAAGTEIAAIGQDDHGMHIIAVGHIAEPVAQFSVTFKGQRILAVGAVQAQPGNAVLYLA